LRRMRRPETPLQCLVLPQWQARLG